MQNILTYMKSILKIYAKYMKNIRNIIWKVYAKYMHIYGEYMRHYALAYMWNILKIYVKVYLAYK